MIYIIIHYWKHDFETLDPRDRWEQEQLNEPEQFFIREQLELIHDETEQLNQITPVQILHEEKQQQPNHEQFIQIEQ
jgi:hypothetical protein